MATSKVQVPSPAIFQSDPEEQIYARGTLDRDMSGLSYMFKNAAQTRREQDQGTYLQGVSEANRVAAALQQQEDRMKMVTDTLKMAPDFAKAGLPIDLVPLLAQHFNGQGMDEQTRAASSLPLDLIRSEIAKNNAAGAAHGAAGAPEFTGETQITPEGVSIESMKVKTKGGDSAVVQEILRQRALQAMKARGIQGSGPGGTGLSNSGPAWTGKTMEYNKQRRE